MVTRRSGFLMSGSILLLNSSNFNLIRHLQAVFVTEKNMHNSKSVEANHCLRTQNAYLIKPMQRVTVHSNESDGIMGKGRDWKACGLLQKRSDDQIIPALILSWLLAFHGLTQQRGLCTCLHFCRNPSKQVQELFVAHREQETAVSPGLFQIL